MEDFFKNLKGDSIFHVENPGIEPKIDENSLLVQKKSQENINVLQPKDEPVYNPIKNMDLVTPDGSGLQDKIKDENNKAIEELTSQPKPIIDETNLLVQNKVQENINVLQPKDEPVHNPIKNLDMITSDSSGLQDKAKIDLTDVNIQPKDEPVHNPIKNLDMITSDSSGLQDKAKIDLTDVNNKAIEEMKSQPNSDSNEENSVIVTSHKTETMKKVSSAPPDVREINEKLNEISLQSQAALEDLRTQSTKIVDHAKAQTTKVLENAKVNFNVFTKALEQELEPQQTVVEMEPTSTPEETFEELVERFSRNENIMDFFN